MRSPLLRTLARLAVVLLVLSPAACAHSSDAKEDSAKAAKKEAKQEAKAAKYEAKVQAYEADLPTWDAAKMTTLTKQLADETNAIDLAYRASPEYWQSQSTSGPAEEDLRQTFRMLSQSSASLASMVGKGKGAYETHGLVQHIGELLDEISVAARSIYNNFWTDKQALPAMKTVNEIAYYYGHGPVYDLDNMTKIGMGPNPNRRKEGQ